jgi:hypothetical protein
MANCIIDATSNLSLFISLPCAVHIESRRVKYGAGKLEQAFKPTDGVVSGHGYWTFLPIFSRKNTLSRA